MGLQQAGGVLGRKGSEGEQQGRDLHALGGLIACGFWVQSQSQFEVDNGGHQSKAPLHMALSSGPDPICSSSSSSMHAHLRCTFLLQRVMRTAAWGCPPSTA